MPGKVLRRLHALDSPQRTLVPIRFLRQFARLASLILLAACGTASRSPTPDDLDSAVDTAQTEVDASQCSQKDTGPSFGFGGFVRTKWTKSVGCALNGAFSFADKLQFCRMAPCISTPCTASMYLELSNGSSAHLYKTLAGKWLGSKSSPTGIDFQFRVATAPASDSVCGGWLGPGLHACPFHFYASDFTSYGGTQAPKNLLEIALIVPEPLPASSQIAVYFVTHDKWSCDLPPSSNSSVMNQLPTVVFTAD